MKVHYINILLFVIPLNILINDQRNHKNTTHHTPKISTTRLLCECELYSPANYNNDPQMKEVMQQFVDRTTQRFHEYDERMQGKRQKCKEQCDKEIQKIVLKDKIEKQMEQQLTTLETKIHTDDIPTCICEKSLADKVEKGCLRCGYGLGTVAPTVGLIGSVAVHAWKPLALKATIEKALELNAATIASAAQAAGIKAGKGVAIKSLRELGVEQFWTGMSKYILNMRHYSEVADLTDVIYPKKVAACKEATEQFFENMCQQFDIKIGVLTAEGKNGVLPKDAVPNALNGIVAEATEAANIKAAEVTTTKTLAVETAQKEAIEIASYNWYTTIGYSVLAILIIVLIMVIIYLILRYRRKKKMKKKLQYIKLLEE